MPPTSKQAPSAGTILPAVMTSLLVLGLAVWHAPLAYVLSGRMPAVEAAIIVLTLMMAAATACAFYCEPWFARGRLDRDAYLVQNGRLASLLVMLALGLGHDPDAGPSAAIILAAGFATLMVAELAARPIAARWAALVRRAGESS